MDKRKPSSLGVGTLAAWWAGVSVPGDSVAVGLTARSSAGPGHLRHALRPPSGPRGESCHRPHCTGRRPRPTKLGPPAPVTRPLSVELQFSPASGSRVMLCLSAVVTPYLVGNKVEGTESELQEISSEGNFQVSLAASGFGSVNFRVHICPST